MEKFLRGAWKGIKSLFYWGYILFCSLIAPYLFLTVAEATMGKPLPVLRGVAVLATLVIALLMDTVVWDMEQEQKEREARLKTVALTK